MFGLPDGTTACLFDMDGVVTQTALVHAAAWKDMFDKFLRQRAEQSGEKFVPFDSSKDYGDYVDGKPRLDGTRSFLESRGIHLPEGSPDDKPGTPTIQGLADGVRARRHRTQECRRAIAGVAAGTVGGESADHDGRDDGFDCP